MTDTSHQPSALRSLAVLAMAFGAVIAVATLGGLATATGVDTWYRAIPKPSWTPPDALFGPVWTALYAANAVAAWRVWLAAGPWARGALTLFGAQLALNLGWSVLFFGLRSPTIALVDIVVLLGLILATIVAFARHDRLAALLLVPYLAWVAFAGALNAAIVALA